jgi:serine-type D-Ala-D-Ala carboxypeptidase/endopeptidase (penicillin-binding protein 4)
MPGPGLAERIDPFIAQPRFARADWGIAVRSLDSGRTLYAHNADRLFVPASNAKLFTAALALDTLGPDTRIATTLYATSSAIDRNGNLRGDLILYGRGDPSLGLPDVSPDWADRLAAAVAERGVKRIRGELIADATYFSGPPTGDGWEAEDLGSWFAAPASALDVQGNLIKVEVNRDGRRCCTIHVEPDAAGVQVFDQTFDTPDDGDDEPLGLYRPLGSSNLYATGSLPTRVSRRDFFLSAPDPARMAGNLLREALARQGIMVAGGVRVLHWPESDPALTRSRAIAIASIESPTVAELVDHMLKHSDNLYAQSLLLQVGVTTAQRGLCTDRAATPHTSETWALCAMRALLTHVGIPVEAATFSEGSGLSRKDLVTPDAVTRLLAWASQQPWAEDLRAALPVAGVDGTLKNRMRDGAAAGNLQAKTGTLSHAYALSGFVTDANGERLVFSLFLNRYLRPTDAFGRPVPPTPGSDLDAIATMLAGGGTP